jgi:hypothetical protein
VLVGDRRDPILVLLAMADQAHVRDLYLQ